MLPIRPARLLILAVLLAGTAGAEPAAAPAAPPVDPMQRIGSISVGHPHAGYLVNGVRMPDGDGWIVSAPDQAWGTDETIDDLIHCIERVRAQFPDSPRVIVGAISARHGGALRPHKSHRTGRDADVHFYLTKRNPKRWYEPATADNLDRPRTWALLRAVITDTDVEMVLIDQSVQALLEEYAVSIGENQAWLDDLFRGSAGRSSLIKHVPGHTGHMHIRFFNPAAQQRGRDLYDQLVAQGHIPLPVAEAVHVVERGDTLTQIATRYGVSVEDLQRQNGLADSVIQPGQRLVVKKRVDLRGARDPVVIPPRRLPPA